MIARGFIALLIATLSPLWDASVPGPPGETATEQAEQQLGYFNKDRAMTHVRALARDIGIRVRATRNERRGARYIAAEFESLGYRVRIQKFSVDDGTSRNIVAWWPGARRYPVILGGHMDSVPGAPGANDNASGVAVLLETARIAAGTSHVEFLKFVAFGSEEYGADGSHHVGSQVFVNRLGEHGRARLAGMVSVDMVADGSPLIVGTAGIGPDVMARVLFKKIDRKGIEVVYRTTCDCSDNGPFELAGIPGSFMWSGDEPDYHSPSDTVRNMSPKDLGRTGRALRALVAAVDIDLLRRLRER
ncbi:MAG TPA: M28 family peptidase [Actinomycetota bacterium]|nr:M28 family peptidase [Actinomycetota bacterium]